MRTVVLSVESSRNKQNPAFRLLYPNRCPRLFHERGEIVCLDLRRQVIKLKLRSGQSSWNREKPGPGYRLCHPKLHEWIVQMEFHLYLEGHARQLVFEVIPRVPVTLRFKGERDLFSSIRPAFFHGKTWGRSCINRWIFCVRKTFPDVNRLPLKNKKPPQENPPGFR